MGANKGIVLEVARQLAVSGCTVLLGARNQVLGNVSSTLGSLTMNSDPSILAAVALLAVWLPAARASRVDPIRALRAE